MRLTGQVIITILYMMKIRLQNIKRIDQVNMLIVEDTGLKLIFYLELQCCFHDAKIITVIKRL